MTKPNSTEIIFILDRSGSMSPIAADMCGGFKTFIEEQKKIPGECKVTLVQFDDRYETVYEGRALETITELQLLPRGSTALLDAMGRTIDAVGARLGKLAEADRPSKVLFVIITDGAENASHEYNQHRIAEMVKHQQDKYSWDFVFMGANQDAVLTAAKYNISSANAVNFVGAAGAASAGVMRGLSHNVARYRTGKGLGDVQASYDAASQAIPTISPPGVTPDPDAEESK